MDGRHRANPELPRVAGHLGFVAAPDEDGARLRGPAFVLLQSFPKLCEGAYLADLIAILASIDPVLEEASADGGASALQSGTRTVKGAG